MITFRWLILRWFWSLLLLPIVAYPPLWLLHEVVFPGLYFEDVFIVVILWAFLFVGASLILHRMGTHRYSVLDAAGGEALASNNEKELAEIFMLLQRLFLGGLLSNRFHQKKRRLLLRQYFPFYAAHPENERNREQLLVALRENIRADESYEILKTYVIWQPGRGLRPALTLPIMDLAEELLEYNSDDADLLAFLTRHYLNERKSHYRAEYVFTRYLSHDGPMVSEILSLCFDRILRLERQDDFAVWCYLRALRQDKNKNPSIRKMLYEAQQRYKGLGRQDVLANLVATVAKDFTPEEIANWKIEEKASPKKTLRFHIQSAVFHFHQNLLDLYSQLLVHRRWVYLVAGTVLVVGIIYTTLSGGIFKTRKAAEVLSATTEDTTAVYFTLQVGAMRNASASQRDAEELRRQGLEVYVLKPETGRGWHRVRVGKYRSRHAAQAAADSLKMAGIIRDYFIANYTK